MYMTKCFVLSFTTLIYYWLWNFWPLKTIWNDCVVHPKWFCARLVSQSFNLWVCMDWSLQRIDQHAHNSVQSNDRMIRFTITLLLVCDKSDSSVYCLLDWLCNSILLGLFIVSKPRNFSIVKTCIGLAKLEKLHSYFVHSLVCAPPLSYRSLTIDGSSNQEGFKCSTKSAPSLQCPRNKEDWQDWMLGSLQVLSWTVIGCWLKFPSFLCVYQIKLPTSHCSSFQLMQYKGLINGQLHGMHEQLRIAL